MKRKRPSSGFSGSATNILPFATTNGTLWHLQLLLLLVICCSLCPTALAWHSTMLLHRPPLKTPLFGYRGGEAVLPNQNTSATSIGSSGTDAAVEQYVAAMKEKDNQNQTTTSSSSSSSDAGEDNDQVGDIDLDKSQGDTAGTGDNDATASPSSETSTSAANQDDDASVGIKSHSHRHASKNSRIVGHPDGGNDDDDDDDNDNTSDDELDPDLLSDFSEDWEDTDRDLSSTKSNDVQVQVEVVGTPPLSADETEQEKDSEENGDVGVRIGRRNSRRTDLKSSSNPAAIKSDQDRLLDAWLPHVYFPPTGSALNYLKENARLIDSSSRTRLDRRTLYAALLLEWGSVDSKLSTNNRKFLTSEVSQSLQAALSMATQPQWRKSAPRSSGIRLYREQTLKTPTLAMQETVAMALAHSMGCGFLVLDDHILNKVRNEMIQTGLSDEAVKPATLLQSLVSMATEGKIQPIKTAGSISSSMKQDIALGLDDLYDDRATISCEEMRNWEQEWNADLPSQRQQENNNGEPLPLVIFIRTTSSSSLLKSKSAMELLIRECTSDESIHLVALGKGVDASTVTLPEQPKERQEEMPPQGNWNPGVFGFSAENQNASGQNDPKGSRRFNIFLARAVNPSGQPGIFGAIAPPEAGNLFPRMIAMRAIERLQNKNEGGPPNDQIEHWNHVLNPNSYPNVAGSAIPPPQFFNASLAYNGPPLEEGQQPPQPPPEVIQQVLQQTMNHLLDHMAQEAENEGMKSSMSPPAQKAFAQVLRNESLRRGIAENLARAAPALSDPKCQGVMLSVYVPPPVFSPNRNQQLESNNNEQQQRNPGNWFQDSLDNERNIETDSEELDEAQEQRQREKRMRTIAAAAAVLSANSKNSDDKRPSESKAGRNLKRLESICRPIPLETPQDPVRSKSWEAWISREQGTVNFRQNRKALHDELTKRNLSLEHHTGTKGAGFSLRQMLSVRNIVNEIPNVVKCAVELEAAKSLRHHESTKAVVDCDEKQLEIDVSLSQLMVDKERFIETTDETLSRQEEAVRYRRLHPSTLESALSLKCQLSPSPSGCLSVSNSPVLHRTKEEISALAQDKHERALISQVVSPQDIGVTYDMIGGLSDVKELLRQSITYPLKFPHLYSEGIAREAVKGVLLFGPPGTGKTMLAKAVATEGGASFLSVDASSVENKWLGESEKNAKAVFTLARRLAPCVVFIDEVDSLLSSREGSSDDSAHGTLTSVKTTMMSEWDGLNSGTNGSGDRVVVIGSTNRPFDLDEAVLRRFPRRILVDLPDLDTRKEILEVTLAENRLDPSVNLTEIAALLEGYTGSDIKEVCREAVVRISHEQARLLDQGFQDAKVGAAEGSLQRLRPVTMEDFESAMSKLKRSVSEKGRELARVWEWNDEYGEIKKEKSNRLPQLMNMYL